MSICDKCETVGHCMRHGCIPLTLPITATNGHVHYLDAIPSSDIGVKILRHIKAKYRTQAVAAKAWEVDRSAIWRMITGKIAPSPMVLAEMGLQRTTIYITNKESDAPTAP